MEDTAFWKELGGVEDLKDDGALGEAMKAKTLTVIFLYMSACHHCKDMWPIIKKLAAKRRDTKFKRIESNNVGSNSPENLNGFPHYVMVGKGPMKSFGGSMGAEELESKLFGKSGGRSARGTRRVRKFAHRPPGGRKGLRRKFRSTRKRS